MGDKIYQVDNWMIVDVFMFLEDWSQVVVEDVIYSCVFYVYCSYNWVNLGDFCFMCDYGGDFYECMKNLLDDLDIWYII